MLHVLKHDEKELERVGKDNVRVAQKITFIKKPRPSKGAGTDSRIKLDKGTVAGSNRGLK